MGQGDCGLFDGSGVGRNSGALPSVLSPLVPIRENVYNGQAGEGGAIIDGLHPGNGPPSLQENVRPGPQAQLRSVHGLGLPPQQHPEGTHKVPQALHIDTPRPRTTLTR